LAIAPEKARAPYDVQIITEDGDTAPTYALRGRYYVQGNLNERYIIRVTNPTPSRVEAVVSVDGSYAGRKGKARNVGVIAVAIFEEQARPADVQIIQPEVTVRPRPRPYYRYDRDDSVASRGADKKAAEAPSAGEAAGDMDGAVGGAAQPAPRMRPPVDEDYEAPPPPVTTQTAPRTNRPGLGTEFGEQRYSAASYTKFVRAPGRPIAIAELRYNDVQGLMALGIPVAPMPDEGEIMMRETADPFPGDRFAKPPVR
jgi:hypothetical protein